MDPEASEDLEMAAHPVAAGRGSARDSGRGSDGRGSGQERRGLASHRWTVHTGAMPAHALRETITEWSDQRSPERFERPTGRRSMVIDAWAEVRHHRPVGLRLILILVQLSVVGTLAPLSHGSLLQTTHALDPRGA